MKASEGDIIEGPQGQFFVIKDGQLAPYTPDYREVFKNDDRTAGQTAMGIASAINEGAYLGFGDEVTGLYGSLMGDPSVRQGAENIRSDFQERNPASNVALEIAGTLINPLTRSFGTKAVAAKPFLGSAGVGGAFGAAFGAGKANEGERLEGGLIGGSLGAALGGPLGYGAQLLSQKALPAMTSGLSYIKNALTPGINAPQQQADDIARQFLMSGFQSSDDPAQAAISRLQGLGENATLMDVSPEMAALANQAYEKQIGGFQTSAKRFFDARSRDGMNRIMSNIKSVFGKRAEGSAIAQSVTDKSTQAGKLFDAARSQSVDPQVMGGFVAQLDDQLRLNENTTFAGALNKLKRSIMSGKGKDAVIKTSVDQLHRARMDLADDASDAFLSGRMEKWRMLKDLRNSFDEALPPEYSQAMKLSAQKRQIESASEAGQKFFMPSNKTEDFLEWIVDATDQEKSAYMMGLVKAAKEKMGNVTDGGKVSRFFNTPNVKEKMTALIGDPRKADEFIASIERENIFKATENLVMGNSFTSARREASQIFDKAAGNAAQEAPSSQGEFMRSILTKVMETIKIDKSMSPDVAKALTSRLTEKGLTPETIEMLMRTPAKDKVIAVFNAYTPAAGAQAAKASGIIGAGLFQ